MLQYIAYIISKIKKVFQPPKSVSEDSKKAYQKRIVSEWRELIFIDIIIIAFLIASAHQLAYFFAGGEPTFWSWVKAIGFDGAIALFSRNVSRAAVLKEKARGTWIALIVLMAVTVLCNIGYEWLIETGGVGVDYVVTDPIKNIRALLVSGSLAIIILGITAVRALAAKSFEQRQKKYRDWAAQEEKRKKAREYQRGYNEKKRKAAKKTKRRRRRKVVAADPLD